MQGFSMSTHLITVSLNGNPLGTISTAIRHKACHSSMVNTACDRGPEHRHPNGSGRRLDTSVVDYIRVSYWHSYSADGNA